MKNKRKNTRLISENTYSENIKSKYIQAVKKQFEFEGGLEKKLENSKKTFEATGKLIEYEGFKHILYRNMMNQNKINIDHFSVEPKESTMLIYGLMLAGEVEIIADIVTNYLGLEFKYGEEKIDIFQLACMSCNVNIVKLCVELKHNNLSPKSSILNCKNEKGVSLLNFVIMSNLKNDNVKFKSEITELTDYFCELGADLNAKDINGQDIIFSILEMAIVENKLSDFSKQIMRHLIKKGANFKESYEDQFEKIFSHLGEIAELKILRELVRKRIFSKVKKSKIDYRQFEAMLKENDIAPDATDEKGCNMLHYAAWFGHVAVFPLLLPSNDIDKQDEFGMTPMLYAMKNDRNKAAEILMELGANVLLVNKYNEGMMHYAASNNQVDIMKKLVKINKGFLTARSTKGHLAIHRAAASGCLEAVEYLLNSGQDINDVAKNGDTPLHLAGDKGHENLFKYLIEAGAATNIPNKEGILSGEALNLTNLEETSEMPRLLRVNVPSKMKLLSAKIVCL